VTNFIYTGTTVFTMNRFYCTFQRSILKAWVYRMLKPCIPFSQHHGQGLITPVACAPVVTENIARNMNIITTNGDATVHKPKVPSH